MRRLTKIRKSIYEPESYAVYVDKNGEQYSAITMTANQTQRVLDKLAMYEDLDAHGLVRGSDSRSENNEKLIVPEVSIKDIFANIDSQLDELNKKIEKLTEGKVNET